MNSAFPIRSELFYSIDAVTYILSNVSILKILGVTCDNASANDAMLDELDSMLAHFEGEGMRVHCILHIGNLIAKTLIKQFDVPQHKESDEIDEHRKVEEYETADVINTDLEKDNNIDGWIDETAVS